MEVWLVVLHFLFNGEDVSVWPRSARVGYSTEALCKPAERAERALWRGKWPAPTAIKCEKVEIAK